MSTPALPLGKRFRLWRAERGSTAAASALAEDASNDAAIMQLALERFLATTPRPSWVKTALERWFKQAHFRVIDTTFQFWSPISTAEFALETLRGPATEARLLALLAADDPFGQQVAALSLGYYKAHAARDAIVLRLDSKDDDVKRAACAAIGRLGLDLATLARLKSKLGESAYLGMLVQLGTDDAIDAIRDAACAQFAHHAETLLFALAKTRGDAVLRPLLESNDYSGIKLVMPVLFPKLTVDDLPIVRRLVGYTASDIRLPALKKLGELAPAEAGEAILAELAQTDQFPTVKDLAELMLGLNFRAGAEPLRAALAKPFMQHDTPREPLAPKHGPAFEIFDTPLAQAMVTKNRLETCKRVEEIIYLLTS